MGHGHHHCSLSYKEVDVSDPENRWNDSNKYVKFRDFASVSEGMDVIGLVYVDKSLTVHTPGSWYKIMNSITNGDVIAH